MQNFGMSARRLATRSMAAALALVALLYARRSEAHFNLIMPPPADSATDGGKGAPPCGPTTASNVVTSVQGGHAIMLQLDETVLHPGWYRVALSINSRSELPADPMVTVSNGNSTNATYETNPVFPVLADHLFAHTSGTTPIHYSMSLMLPNVTCTKCTLQVIEFMNMHGANPGGGYFYHHCAEVKITADPNLPCGGITGGGTDGGTTDAPRDGAEVVDRHERRRRAHRHGPRQREVRDARPLPPVARDVRERAADDRARREDIDALPPRHHLLPR